MLAQDLINNLYGSYNFSITILTDDPVVILVPASGSVPTYTDFYLTANQSYDPDGISQLSFKWECLYNGFDCPFFFQDNLPALSIPQIVNYNKQISSITLRASKSTRRLQQGLMSSMTFFPTFVPFYCPSVNLREYFTKKQIQIALSKKPLVVEAVTNDTSGYSLL